MTLDPLQLAPAAISLALYARRAATLRGTPRAVPAWRQACFCAGVVLTAASLAVAGDDAEELFWVHMAEHLLIADVAALLLVLGLTGPVVAPVLRIPLFARLRAIAHPAPALLLWALNLLAWHVPALHEAAVRHEALHALQHLSFIVLGANVWMCLFGPLPMPEWFGNAAKVGYIVAVRLVGAILANALLFGGDAFYGVYAAGEAAHGISPESDQTTAGSIMMVEESILTICLFCWLFLKAAREGEQKQALLDHASARGVELSDARAARAVSAGRADELRTRIDADAQS